MSEAATLFGEAITEAAAGPLLGGHGQVTKALMVRLAEKGLTLAELADRKMMNRSIRTLEAHAREFKLAFPDYVPMALRVKIEFVRMGDFYELFGERAPAVAERLGIVVTHRRGDAQPMCGIPVHGFEDARAKLEPAFIIRIGKPPKKAKAK